MLHISEEAPGDAGARELLLDRVFGGARFAKTCERLREGRLPAHGLALVAKDADDRLVGTVRLWHVAAGSAGTPTELRALLLGPLAVAPEAQGTGLGSALMWRALNRAAVAGHRAVLLVGDASYYRRFGFEAGLTTGLDLPGPVDRARFLGLALEPGALAGATGLIRATGVLAPAFARAAVDAAAPLRAAA